MEHSLDTLEAILARHASALAEDFTPYRNHACRVVHVCAALAERELCDETLEKMQIAVAFHDLGIWTDRTFDYIAPSMQRAREYLYANKRVAWVPEIDAMILEHHKLRKYSAQPGWLVEAFRRADWVDVTYGARSFGLPRSLVRDLFRRYPDHGFHRRLVQLSVQRASQHPLSPLPMMRY
ncbi:MAG: phosphohydrolase [Polyangiales bacterium]